MLNIQKAQPLSTVEVVTNVIMVSKVMMTLVPHLIQDTMKCGAFEMLNIEKAQPLSMVEVVTNVIMVTKVMMT